MNSKMEVEDWKMLFRVIYGCALRIKETTKLTPNNFNLNHFVLTLNETKTGWEHCKCSKFKKRKLISSDKDCNKCQGEGWVRTIQKTSILPRDAKLLEDYLKGKEPDLVLWPVSRQTIWIKFRDMCNKANLHYYWEKKKRSFEDNPYLLRSSRAKIMEKMQAPHSYVKLKLRHTIGSDVTLAYTMPDIHALIGWEAEHYPLIVA